jgi:cyclopropane-fatty-acyl-phospholipid synthase
MRPPTQRLVDALAARLPGVFVTAYTGASAGPRESHTTLLIKSQAALIQLMRAPRGLGLARAWVTGTIDVTGDLHELVQHEISLRDPKLYRTAAAAALQLAPFFRLRDIIASGPPSIEYRKVRAGRHSIPSDLVETEFHYGRSLAFYKHLLGPSLTYSCAIFTSPSQSLESAQAHKHATICQRLRLGNDSVLLDVGCGWGSLLRHAVQHYSCEGEGLTASKAQYLALRSDLELAPSGVSIRYGDYRQLLPVKGVTAAASIGVYEHVGHRNSCRFFTLIRSSLEPGSRYLNQSIVRSENGPKRFRANSFTQRYIFPNAQLRSLSEQIRDLERAGFQILSVDLHGSSYAQTLRCWIKNLLANWDSCVSLEGEQRARAWHMYLTGALTRFERRSIDLVQVLCQAR